MVLTSGNYSIVKFTVTEELGSLAGNAVNLRSTAAAWICGFSCVSQPLWEDHAKTGNDY